jgi:UPF0755 protein
MVLCYQYRAFLAEPLAIPSEGMEYELRPGTSVKALSKDLAERGALRHPWMLSLLARQEGLAHRIQAGEYQLTPGTTPEALLQQLAEGKVKLHEFTIIEGQTFGQLMQRLQQQAALIHTLEGLPDEAIMERLGHPGEHPEGRFLPDTYRFPKGTTDVEFLQRAHGAMRRFLRQAWDEREEGLPLQTSEEALILASIVEKETGQPEERPEIAGVFLRRLRKGMRLQTDPTVIYGLGPDFDGDIRYRDLRRDTPYNTYTRHGLPPTPIAMPGRAAIEAVLHPAPGNSLYFVSRGDGTHVFSATLEAHNRAVRKYQLKR